MDETALAEAEEEELEGMRTVRLRIPARAEYVALARLALSGLADIVELPEELLADLKLALTEAVSNSVRHAYADGSGLRLDRLRAPPGCTRHRGRRRRRRIRPRAPPPLEGRSSRRAVSASRSSGRSRTSSSSIPSPASVVRGFGSRSGCTSPPDRCQTRQRLGVSSSSSSTAPRSRTDVMPEATGSAARRRGSRLRSRRPVRPPRRHVGGECDER